jgi:tryptophan synthase alpha chain
MHLVHEASLGIPVAAMTYLNPVWRMGTDRFLDRARAAGISGVIVPDLPVDEATMWTEACAVRDVAPVLLVAPGERDERLRWTARSARGFVYCVATYGVTGVRDALPASAGAVVAAMRPLSDLPLLVGVGIGAPDQARAACEFADGVVVGSALVRPLLDGDRDGAVSLAREFRRAIPEG